MKNSLPNLMQGRHGAPVKTQGHSHGSQKETYYGKQKRQGYYAFAPPDQFLID
jgi:hypothetical protein